MTKEQITPYASEITYVWNRTVLYFKDGKVLSGYFKNNTNVFNKEAPNEWGFVCLPKENDKEIILSINGDDLSEIKIIEWNELKSILSR